MHIHFHGLGAMGLPMALHLQAAGHTLDGIDPLPSARTRWRERSGATPADHPRQAPDVVVLCVTDEPAARAVIADRAQGWPRGSLVLDHTTTSTTWAREVHAYLARQGIAYCDAPLSGGVPGAERGELVAMLGAPEDALARALAVLAAYTREVIHLGGPGAGQTCKMANQIAIAGIAVGLETARSFALAQGLPLARVFAALAQGTAASVQLERLGHALGDPESHPDRRFAWLEKDLALYEGAGMQADPATTALLALCRKHLHPSPTE